ncbi:MAG: hypothetical protein ACI4EN_00585 [Butyrivibrio sp.]
MKNKLTKILAFVTALTLVLMLMPRLDATYKIKAAVRDVSSISELQDILSECATSQEAIEVKLTSDLTGVTSTFTHTGGNLSIDLNGYSIKGSISGTTPFIFNSSSGELEFTDSSPEQTGSISNTAISGGAVNKTGGNLVINGGNYIGCSLCIQVSNCTASITGGNFESDNSYNSITLWMDGKSTVNIYGNPVFTSSDGVLYMPDNSSGNSLTVEGGSFTANENGKWSYACYLGGDDTNTAVIKGGQFVLNANAGKALCIGSNVNVKLSGGKYTGGIGKSVSGTDEQNYSAYYGDNGILSNDYVLTDNRITYETGTVNTINDEISVVKGKLVKLDIQRSLLDSDYTGDLYALVPVSVDESGRVYTNGDSNTVPDNFEIPDGNIYKFNGWYDQQGEEFSSVGAYISHKGTELTDTTLKAEWNGEITSQSGLSNALINSGAVKNILLKGNITLNSGITVNAPELMIERTLDLGGYTINYSNTTKPALILNGLWKIGNGSINSTGQGAMQIYGTAVIENLKCISDNSNYAVGFINVIDDSPNRIISGTFEITGSDGYAIYATAADGTGTAGHITGLFKDSNASSTATYVNGSGTYLKTTKLIVSRNPITYIQNGGAIDMGRYSYGDVIAPVKAELSNKDYTGDIVITGVSVDNAAFKVTGKTTGKTLTGGSTDTYTYTIETAGVPNPGSYECTVSINYIKMDGTAGTYKHKITLIVEAKPNQTQPDISYTLSGTKGSSGWYITSVTVYPEKGCTISAKRDGEYSDYYIVESTSSPVIYIKNEKGEIAGPVQLEKIFIDTEAPRVTGVEDKMTYYGDELVAEAEDDNLEQVTVNGENVSFSGNHCSISLKPSLNEYVIIVSDKAGNVSEYTVRVEETWMKEGINSVGTIKLYTQKAYKLGAGKWKVNNDSTVYNGGISFYVTEEGEYEFQKQ